MNIHAGKRYVLCLPICMYIRYLSIFLIQILSNLSIRLFRCYFNYFIRSITSGFKGLLLLHNSSSYCSKYEYYAPLSCSRYTCSEPYIQCLNIYKVRLHNLCTVWLAFNTMIDVQTLQPFLENLLIILHHIFSYFFDD